MIKLAKYLKQSNTFLKFKVKFLEEIFNDHPSEIIKAHIFDEGFNFFYASLTRKYRHVPSTRFSIFLEITFGNRLIEI